MGEVFRAVDQTTGETVALKRLRLDSESSSQRFVREGSILALLSHPSLVRYVGHGADGGDAYIAMEWLRGEDLQQRLQRGRLSAEESLEIAARVADGLSAAHAHGVIHRDVKPSNVFLVDGDPRDVRLLDFGIAKSLTSSQRMTATGSLLGTLGYLSPEQALGEEVDARSDVFSLGCVLFECLTGHPPFTAAHPAAILAKVVMQDAPMPSSIERQLERFDPLLEPLLARDRHARPDDGAAAAALIRAALAGASSAERAAPAITAREREALTVMLSRARGEEDQRERLVALATEARARPIFYGDDAVLCIWDADVARDQVLRAARLALAVQRELGRASVIAMGYGERAGDHALGDVVERAAALAERQSEIETVVDDASAEILRRRFEILRSERGLSLGRELDMSEDRHERAPLVGRDRELRLLLDTYRECAEESVSRALLLTGEPGIGKSRLLRELLRQCAGTRVWKARADPMRPGGAYTLLSQLVRRAIGLGVDGHAEDARALLAERDLGETPTVPVADFLLEVLDLAGDDATEALRSARSDPSLMATRVREAVAAFCLATCRGGPLVIALEDLHWGDAPTLRVIDHVVARCSELPLLVLGAARPDFRVRFPGAWASEHFQEIRLAGLSRKAAEKLAYALAGTAAPDRITRAVERAGGSPLWLEELFRERDASGEVPNTLLAIIQAHLAREPQLERRVLRGGAIFGERFFTRGVAVLVGGDPGEVDECLRGLVAKEWIVRVGESRLEGQVEMGFRHGLLRDAVYATLTAEDQRVGHGLAARWLMSAGETDPVAIAAHLERSERPAEAIPHYVRAANQALAANDLEGALLHATRGRELGASGGALWRLRTIDAEGATWLGDIDRADAMLKGLVDEVDPNDSVALSVIGWASMIASMKGDNDTPLRAITLFERLDRTVLPEDEYQRTGSYLHSNLLFAGERARADSLVALLEREPTGPNSNRAAGWLAHTRFMHARMSVGDTWAERCVGLEGLRSFRAAFDSAGELHMLGQVALTELSLGAFDRAMLLAREGIPLAHRYNHQLLLAYPLGAAACACAALGDNDLSVEYCEQALALASQLRNEIYGMYVRILVAYAFRLANDPTTAIATARSVCADAKLFAVRCAGLMQLAGALADGGEYEEALACCLEVASLTQPRHMRGALDLEFMGTFVRVLAKTGPVDAHEALRQRAAKIVARRAAVIDDARMRDDFLRWTAARVLIS